MSKQRSTPNAQRSTLSEFFHAPFALLHGSRDGATVTKATIAIFAGGVALSVLAFASIKIWAACQDYEEAPVTPFLCTDFDDFPPGTTANIYGTGFQAGETVQVQVLRKDQLYVLPEQQDLGPENAPFTATADANGEIHATWTVPADGSYEGLTIVATATGLSSSLTAQAWFTDPVTAPSATVSVPYAQDFSDALPASSTVYPAGWAGWRLSATGTGTSGNFRTADPNTDANTANASLLTGSASSTTGGIYNYNGKIGFLGSGSFDPGIVLQVSTVGQRNIKLTFRIGTLRNPNTRVNAVDVQMRIGTSGTFASLSGSGTTGAGVYQNTLGPLKTGTGDVSLQNPQTVTLSLPATANNQSTIQLRWVQREVSGSGGQPSFAIDDVVVYEDVDCDISALAQDNNDNTPYPTSGSYLGLNGGRGFDPWANTTDTGGGVFTENTGGQLDGARSFGIFATGSGGFAVIRGLAFPVTKGSFTVEMRHNNNNTVGFNGFNLRKQADTVGSFGGAPELISVGLTPGTGNTSVFVGGGDGNKTIPLGSEIRGQRMQYTVSFDTAAGTYTVSAKFLDPLNAGGASGSVSGTLKATGACVAAVGFANFNASAAGNQNVIFDALQVNVGDNADNTVYENGWQLEGAPFTCAGCDNGGFGLGIWAAIQNLGAGGGTFVATGGAEVDGARSWGIFANFSDPGSDPSGHAIARPLATPTVRGHMSVLIRHNVNNARGFTGFNLREAFFGTFGNMELLSVGLAGNNDNNCVYIGDSTGFNQRICFNGSVLGKRMLYKVEWDTIAGTYTVIARDLDAAIQPTGTDRFSGSLKFTTSGGVQSFGFANFNRATSGSGDQNVIVDRLVVASPVATGCPGNITTSTDPNLCTAVVTYTTPGDSCPAANASCSPASGTAFPKGTTTVTCTGSDSACFPINCSFTVTVNDNQAPSITCPANVNAQCATSDPGASFTGGTATDNCPPAPTVTVQSNVISGQTCANKYTRTVVFRATDSSGNFSECTRVITINDNTAPVLTGVPSSTTVQCASQVPAAPTVTANDNCDGSVPVSFTETSNGGTGCPASPLILTRTWSATDQCGNNTTAVRTVTVSDTTNPTALCKNITVSLSASNPGTVTVNAADVDNGSSDNCGPVTLAIRKANQVGFTPSVSFGCGEVQNNTVTLQVTDACGNIATCTATVTVQDNTPPTITCPATATAQCDGSIAPSATGTATATDNCSATVSFADSTAGSCPTVVTRTWTATDPSGNSASCVQTINVVDTTPPVVTAPANTTVECPGNTSVGANGTATATDNCDFSGGTFTLGSESFGTFTAAGFTATPGAGQLDSDIWRITGLSDGDTSFGGSFTTGDYARGTSGGDVTDGGIYAFDVDNGPGVNRALGVQPSGDDFTPGTKVFRGIVNNTGVTIHQLTVSYTVYVRNNAPRASSYNFSHSADGVTFTAIPALNVTSPLAADATPLWVANPRSATLVGLSIPPNGIYYIRWSSADVAGSGTRDEFALDDILITATGGLTISSSDSVAPGCGNTKTITRTWSATDSCGNTGTANQTITVVDTQAPVLSGCPNPDGGTFQCYSQVPAPANVTANDACQGSVAVTVTTVESNPGSSCNNTITRTYTATDGCGNSASCTQTITVNDTTGPVLSGVPPNASFQCYSQVPAAPTVTFTDNCGASGTASFTETQSNPGSSCNNTITRTWTATDSCGNTTTQSQVITVNDTTDPTLVGVPANTTADCSAVPAPANVTATDNCNGATVTFSETTTPGNCAGNYTITRTWTATDGCGNSTSDSQVITVTDNTGPAVTAPANATVECGSDTSPTATGTATAQDDCSGVAQVSYTDSETPGANCSVDKVKKTITRTWKAVDNCGNSGQAVQTITVKDTTVPSISCPPAFTGSAPPPANFAGGSASDTCGSVTISHSDGPQTPNACGYSFTRTYTATDQCGNSASCTQQITVSTTFATDCIMWHAPLAQSPANHDTDPSCVNPNDTKVCTATYRYPFKGGSTIPIQIHANGCVVDATGNPNVVARVQVFADVNCDGFQEAEVLIDYNGVGDPGGMMDKIDGHFKYNLDTKTLTTAGCHILRVTVTDTATGESCSEEVWLKKK
jgi:hypothetical protein